MAGKEYDFSKELNKKKDGPSMIDMFGCLIVPYIILGIIFVFFLVSYNVNSPDHANRLDKLLVETDGQVLPENEGKLVLVTGTPVLANDGVITDKEMGIKVNNACYYERMAYQKLYKVEKEEVIVDKHDRNDPNDDETEIREYVVKSWEVAGVDRPEVIKLHGRKYKNPPKKNVKSVTTSNPLKLGDFEFFFTELKDVVTVDNNTLSKDQINQFCGRWMRASKYPFHAMETDKGTGYLATGDNIGALRIHISYKTVSDSQEVTVIGKQEGKNIKTFDNKGYDEYYVLKGKVTKEQFVADMAKKDLGDQKVCKIVMAICVILAALMTFLAYLSTKTFEK